MQIKCTSFQNRSPLTAIVLLERYHQTEEFENAANLTAEFVVSTYLKQKKSNI